MSEDEDWQPPTESELKVIQARRERSDRISKLMGDYLLKGYKMLGTCCAVCDTILLQDKHGANYCVACQELESDNVKDDPALSSEAALRQAAEQKQKSTPPSKTPSPTEQEARSILLSSVIPSASSSSLPSTTTGELQQQRALKPEQQSVPESLSDHANRSDFFDTPPSHFQECPDPSGATGKSQHRGGSLYSQSSGGSDVPIQESFGGAKTRHSESHRHPPKRSLSHGKAATCTAEYNAAINQALDVLYSKLQKASTELQQSRDVRHCTDLCHLIKGCAEAAESLRRLQSSQTVE